MWVVPERIGRDGNPSSEFSSISTVSTKGWGRDTQVNVERNRDFWGPGLTVDSHFYATTRDKFVDPDRREQRQAARDGPDLPWSPDAVLVDTVAHLEWDMDDMRAESRNLRTPGGGGGVLYANPDRQHARLLKCRSLMGRLVGNNTNRCLTPLCFPMDGMT